MIPGLRGPHSRPLPGILAAGVAGAILIALYLVVPKAGVFQAPSLRVLFQWDASNALGPAAFQGGWPAAALGLGMHLCVSIAWATVFALAAARVGAVARHPVLSGLLFGVLVYLVMSFGVVPLGSARQGPRTAKGIANNLIAHAIFFGLPVVIVLTLRKAGRSSV
jgi:hypothetical protein